MDYFFDMVSIFCRVVGISRLERALLLLSVSITLRAIDPFDSKLKKNTSLDVETKSDFLRLFFSFIDLLSIWDM